MTDLTITAVHTTTLRVPWPQNPWLKGHRFGDARTFLVVDVETKGGITGMGYLFLFRPGIKSIIACLNEVIIPNVIGKDASAVEAIWQHLWNTTVTFGRGGIATMAQSALDIALWDIVGSDTHFTRFDLKPFFENPLLPILQPDPMRGGMTELRKIATVADTWNMSIAPHLFPELNFQLLPSF